MRVVLKNLMRRNPTIFNPLWAFLYPLMYRRDGKYFGSVRLPPFILPPPLSMVPDFVAPEPPRYVGLWSREQVAAVQSNSSLSSSL